MTKPATETKVAEPKVAAKTETKVAAKTETKVVAKTEEKKPRGRQPSEGPTIISIALEAIAEGKDNKEVLAEVKTHFPESKTRMASINWYRNKAREEDPTILPSREITKARGAEKKAAEKKVKAEAKKQKANTKVDPTS